MVKIKKVFLILSLITLYMAIFAPLGEASATISEKAASSLALDAIKREYNKTNDEMAEYVLAEAAFRPCPDGTGSEWVIIFAGIADHPELGNPPSRWNETRVRRAFVFLSLGQPTWQRMTDGHILCLKVLAIVFIF